MTVYTYTCKVEKDGRDEAMKMFSRKQMGVVYRAIKKERHIGYVLTPGINVNADGLITFMGLDLSEINGSGAYLIYQNTVMWSHGVS